VVSETGGAVLVGVEDDGGAGVGSAVRDGRDVVAVGMLSMGNEEDDEASDDEVSTGVDDESDIDTVVGNESDVGNVFGEASPANELNRSVE
jgi:hypothetical protein